MKTEFEQQLQSQPLRELPRAWRSQILAAAAPPAPPNKFSWLTAWLWPHPRAWAGLAVAWVLIFLLRVSAPEDAGVARNAAPVSFQSMALLRQQTLLMAQLLGSMDASDLPAATPAPPKPRSERPRRQLIG